MFNCNIPSQKTQGKPYRGFKLVLKYCMLTF